jgi:hypothetical protein
MTVHFCGKQYDSLTELIRRRAPHLKYNTVYQRIRRGKWSVEDAIATPEHSHNLNKSLPAYMLYHTTKLSVREISYITHLTPRQIYEVIHDDHTH